MKTKLALTIILCGIFLAPLGYTSPVLAASNSIYLAPSSLSVTQGTTFTVSVHMSAAVNVTTVQANLSYPSSQMTYLGTSFASSAFDKAIESWGGGGTVQIGRRTLSTVTGDQLVATISFKAVAATGTGTVTVQDSSALTNDDGAISASYGSSAVTFTSTNPVTETPIASPTPAKVQITSTPTLPADTTPPIIGDAKSEQKAANTQIISWVTNEASTSYVEYGLNTQYGLSASDDTKVTVHKLTLSSAFLMPNMHFHYRIASTDASGNKQYSPDMTFTTLGITYIVRIVDAQGEPLAKAAVTFNGQTVYTDKNGAASLASNPGKQAVTIVYNGQSTSKTVTISPNKLQQIDTIQMVAQKDEQGLHYLIYPALVLVGLVVGVASRFRVRKYLLAAIRGDRTSFLSLPISSMQKVFGDPDPEHNPYLPKSRFGLWRVKKFLNKPIGASPATPPAPTKPAPKTKSS